LWCSSAGNEFPHENNMLFSCGNRPVYCVEIVLFFRALGKGLTEHKVRGRQSTCSSTYTYRTQSNTKYDSFINLNLVILLKPLYY